MVSEQFERENKVRKQLNRLEKFLNNNLDKAQEEIINSRDKNNQELLEENRVLRQLMSEIHQQHQILIDGLEELEV